MPLAPRLATGLALGALASAIAVDLNLPSLVSFVGDRSHFLPICAVAVTWLVAWRFLNIHTSARNTWAPSVSPERSASAIAATISDALIS